MSSSSTCFLKMALNFLSCVLLFNSATDLHSRPAPGSRPETWTVTSSLEEVFLLSVLTNDKITNH